jgi:hypothetical protein
MSTQAAAFPAASSVALDSPYPGTWTVRQARDAYLAENGFTVEAYDAPRTEASFFAISFSVPNPPGHRWGIMLHDLHHVATGFGTDAVGEGEISAWEVGGGLRGLDLYTGAIVLGGTLLGVVLAPRRALRAFRASTRGANLFATRRTYEDLLSMTVSELRKHLEVPEGGLAEVPRNLHPRAPRAATWDSRSDRSDRTTASSS